MINWKRHFDHIFCLHYVGHSDRYIRISKEFERVGILGSGIFSWHMAVDSPFKRKMYKTLPVNSAYLSYFSDYKYADIMLNHYYVMKEALAFGYKKILVFENDICMLKDTSLIEKTLDNAPKDANIVLYDYFEYKSDNKHSAIGDFIRLKNDKSIYHSGAMYLMDTLALSTYVQTIEKQFYAIDDLWNKFDKDTYKIYISEVPLGIQCPAKTYTQASDTSKIYRQMGIDLSLYAFSN